MRKVIVLKGNPASTGSAENPLQTPKMVVVCAEFTVRADFYEGFHDKGAGNRTPLPLPISLLPASGVAAFGSSFRQEPSLNQRSVIFFRSPKPAPSSEGNYI